MAGEQVDNIINKITGTESNSNAGNNAGTGSAGQLLFCDAKSQLDLNKFINAEKPKLVALVGFADYGKSTFIGSLYQLLIQNHEYKGYSLVDSDTYVGFERRVFLRRENSENISDTKRNILGENDILNLILQSEKNDRHQILISDKAGETYSKYISSNAEIENDCVLENADLIIFFVDAEVDSRKLAEHNQIQQKYESLLSRLKDLQKIKAQSSYAIVYTKVDKVEGDDRKRNLKERCALLCDLFKENIGHAADSVFEVNSKDFDNSDLNEIYSKILVPKSMPEAAKELDWVKMEIDSNK